MILSIEPGYLPRWGLWHSAGKTLPWYGLRVTLRAGIAHRRIARWETG